MSRRGWNGDDGRAGISLSRPPTPRVRRRNVLPQGQNARIQRFVALCGRRADVPSCPASARGGTGTREPSACPRIRRSTEHAGGKPNPQWDACPDFRQSSMGRPVVTTPPRRTLYRRTRDRGSGRGPATDGERPARLPAPQTPHVARIARTAPRRAAGLPPGPQPHRAPHHEPRRDARHGLRLPGSLARITPCHREPGPACRATLRARPCAPCNDSPAPCNTTLPDAPRTPRGARAGAPRHAPPAPAGQPAGPGARAPRLRPAGGGGRSRPVGRVQLGAGPRRAADVRVHGAGSGRRGDRPGRGDGALRGTAAPLRPVPARGAGAAGAATAGAGIPVEPARHAPRATTQWGAQGRTPLRPAHNPALKPHTNVACTIFRPSSGSLATFGRTHSEQGRCPCPERPGVSGAPMRRGRPDEAHFPPSSTNATVRDRMLHATWPCRHCGGW
jgi:hypothetical protein